MKIVFCIALGGNNWLDFTLENWELSFIPSIGDEVEIIDFLNEDDIAWAKSIRMLDLTDKSFPYNDLMEIFIDLSTFEVVKKKWINGGVLISITEEHLYNWTFQLDFSKQIKKGRLKRSEPLLSEAVRKYLKETK